MVMIIGGTYKNNETNKTYKVGCGIKIINTTHGQAGQEMVMYIDPIKPFDEIYVKEVKEFTKEFTKVTPEKK